MKKTLLLVAIAITTLLAACSDPVADELIEYNNEDWLTFQTMLFEFETGLDQVAQMGDTEDFQQLEVYLEENLIPEFNEMADYLYSIEAEHEEVQDLHNIQLDVIDNLEIGLEGYYEGVLLLNDGQEDEAFNLIEDANIYFDEAFFLQEDFMDYREALLEEHDIEEEDVEEM